ncbi:hypothetical protein ACP70R_012465 [Stipagrostis hirtigluma subsp. patula]
MGLPSFAASDLDRGPMSAVIICLLALIRDRFASHVGETWHFGLEEKGRMHSMEFSEGKWSWYPNPRIWRKSMATEMGA